MLLSLKELVLLCSSFQAYRFQKRVTVISNVRDHPKSILEYNSYCSEAHAMVFHHPEIEKTVQIALDRNNRDIIKHPEP